MNKSDYEKLRSDLMVNHYLLTALILICYAILMYGFLSPIEQQNKKIIELLEQQTQTQTYKDTKEKTCKK